MIEFPNCKINLGLSVKGKRPDGYHELETIFFPVGLRDAVEVIESASFQFRQSGIVIEVDTKSNLCVKAYRLLEKDFPKIPSLSIWLHKCIPMGAGLGGGSADGSFMIKLLNKLFQLGLSEKKMITYAGQLGSDCPFFILNHPCHARGRGEILEPLEIDLTAYKLLLVYPDIHISTSWAFSQLSPKTGNCGLKQSIMRPIAEWKTRLYNDFEEPVFKRYPELKIIKERLYEAGAIYASLSGSGSVIYGIFKKNTLPQNLEFPACNTWLI